MAGINSDPVPRIDDKDGSYSSGCTLPYWLDSLERPTFSKLTYDETCDFIVVGAGIAGLQSAYCLASHDPLKQIILIDDGEICSGETGRTTAHLQIEIDDYYHVVEQMYGEEAAQLVCDSNHKAVQFIEDTANGNQIDCEFQRLDAYLIPATEDDKHKVIDKELVSARKAGMTVQLLDSKEQLPVYPVDYPSPHWLKFSNQGQFHPLKYLFGISQILTKKLQNCKIYTNTHVNEVVDDESDKGVYVITSEGKRVDGKKIVLGTYAPINDRITMYTKMAEYRTYAMAFEVEKGIIPRALYWDTDKPYNYHRLTDDDTNPQSGKELLIVGGKDNLTGHNLGEFEDRYTDLEDLARKKFPVAGKLRYRWSGQVIEPIDRLPFLGLNPGNKNVYIITGDSGTGMTNQTIGALLIKDLIYGIKNPWKHIYCPSRKMTHNPLEYIKHNLEVSIPSYLDYVKPGDCPDIEELKPGDGCIIREGLWKLAVYKDTNGTLYKFSAICPHLKALVRYNPLEKTFDCPFHGSRFDRFGKAINGPANSNLTEEYCEIIPAKTRTTTVE